MGGSLTTPTFPQIINVIPNRCGEPMNALKGGEEVSPSPKLFNVYN